MVDLPPGFPKYCKDLKQMLDEEIENCHKHKVYCKFDVLDNIDLKIKKMESISDYLKNNNEHNALGDAKWNLELYNFLKH